MHTYQCIHTSLLTVVIFINPLIHTYIHTRTSIGAYTYVNIYVSMYYIKLFRSISCEYTDLHKNAVHAWPPSYQKSEYSVWCNIISSFTFNCWVIRLLLSTMYMIVDVFIQTNRIVAL